MFNIISNLSSLALQVIDKSGYAGLFILSFLENLAIPIPSEIIVPFSAFLATTGRFSFTLVILVATLGNWLGSMTLFSIARFGGRWLLERYGRYVFIHPEDIKRAEGWFHHNGPATVFWFRLVPVGRAIVSIPAGIAHMHVKRFALYTLAGSVIWNLGLGYIGYKAGEHWDVIHVYFEKFDALIVMVIIAVVVGWILYHIKHRK